MGRWAHQRLWLPRHAEQERQAEEERQRAELAQRQAQAFFNLRARYHDGKIPVGQYRNLEGSHFEMLPTGNGDETRQQNLTVRDATPKFGSLWLPKSPQGELGTPYVWQQPGREVEYVPVLLVVLGLNDLGMLQNTATGALVYAVQLKQAILTNFGGGDVIGYEPGTSCHHDPTLPCWVTPADNVGAGYWSMDCVSLPVEAPVVPELPLTGDNLGGAQNEDFVPQDIWTGQAVNEANPNFRSSMPELGQSSQPSAESSTILTPPQPEGLDFGPDGIMDDATYDAWIREIGWDVDDSLDPTFLLKPFPEDADPTNE